MCRMGAEASRDAGATAKKSRNPLINRLARPAILKKTNYFLVNRARGFGREIVLQNAQNAYCAVVSIQVVAATGQTDLARRRMHKQ